MLWLYSQLQSQTVQLHMLWLYSQLQSLTVQLHMLWLYSLLQSATVCYSHRPYSYTCFGSTVSYSLPAKAAPTTLLKCPWPPMSADSPTPHTCRRLPSPHHTPVDHCPHHTKHLWTTALTTPHTCGPLPSPHHTPVDHYPHHTPMDHCPHHTPHLWTTALTTPHTCGPLPSPHQHTCGPLPSPQRLLGLVVKASASGAEEFDSRLRRGDFSRSSHSSALEDGTTVAALPRASGCRVRPGTG